MHGHLGSIVAQASPRITEQALQCRQTLRACAIVNEHRARRLLRECTLIALPVMRLPQNRPFGCCFGHSFYVCDIQNGRDDPQTFRRAQRLRSIQCPHACASVSVYMTCRDEPPCSAATNQQNWLPGRRRHSWSQILASSNPAGGRPQRPRSTLPLPGPSRGPQ